MSNTRGSARISRPYAKSSYIANPARTDSFSPVSYTKTFSMEALNPSANYSSFKGLSENLRSKSKPFSPKISSLLSGISISGNKGLKNFQSAASANYSKEKSAYESSKSDWLSSLTPHAHITKTSTSSNTKKGSFRGTSTPPIVKTESTSYNVYEYINRPTYSYSASKSPVATEGGRKQLTIMPVAEGKGQLVAEAPTSGYTAESTLKKRLGQIRRSGRASMPSSSGSADEPTINISSGGAMGLNFA